MLLAYCLLPIADIHFTRWPDDPIPRFPLNRLKYLGHLISDPIHSTGSFHGGVTASTEVLAAERHAGVHTPVIECKTTIANQQMAYAA